MQKIIELTIDSIDECRHPFQPSHISEELAEYLLSECKATLYNEDIEINVYSKKMFTKDEKKELTNMIREFYGLEVRESNIIREKTNIANLLCFLFGIVFLFLDMLTNLLPLISEILLIFGWVLIWEATYNVIFGEIQNKIKLTRIKKLLNCKVKFIEIKNS